MDNPFIYIIPVHCLPGLPEGTYIIVMNVPSLNCAYYKKVLENWIKT